MAVFVLTFTSLDKRISHQVFSNHPWQKHRPSSRTCCEWIKLKLRGLRPLIIREKSDELHNKNFRKFHEIINKKSGKSWDIGGITNFPAENIYSAIWKKNSHPFQLSDILLRSRTSSRLTMLIGPMSPNTSEIPIPSMCSFNVSEVRSHDCYGLNGQKIPLKSNVSLKL